MKQSFGWGPNKQTYNALSIPLGMNEKSLVQIFLLLPVGYLVCVIMFVSSELHFKKQSRAGYLPGKEIVCAMTKIKPRYPDTQSQNLSPKLFFPQNVPVRDCTHISFYLSALSTFQKHWLHWILSQSCLSSPRKSWHLSYAHLGFGDQFQN